MDIRFLGHSCFELSNGSTRILIDPFLRDNPSSPIGPDDIEPTHIVLTHGHGDHWGDVVEIANRTNAHCIGIVELAWELREAGVARRSDPNLGGTVTLDDDAWIQLVPAWHTSTTPNGTVNTPAGLVVHLDGTTIYHSGDTALFSDMRLIGRREPIDVALLCIGGHYTMDRREAVEATALVGAREVIPCHYNTFPIIEADAQAFKEDVESGVGARVVILDPGQTHSPTGAVD
ncbi:MAG TPA: metal-dependent hydrolase [Solirubrobacteraceae bacterium]|jgi:L-ascorbate metabolism protein UlaG (beta-lactamase superfamily)|nr:metal-dependent hydrolase [Solirubrobacteraceae bacterium]